MHIKVHYSHINLTVVELILPTGALVSECTNTETLKFAHLEKMDYTGGSSSIMQTGVHCKMCLLKNKKTSQVCTKNCDKHTEYTLK